MPSKTRTPLAHAGVLAAATPDVPPFNDFFHLTDNITVVQNLNMVIALTEDTGSFGRGYWMGSVVMASGAKTPINGAIHKYGRVLIKSGRLPSVTMG